MHRSVARNAAYTRSGVAKRERHNERHNKGYSNPDVILAMSHLNVHFKKCEEGYIATLDKMIADKVVSTSGLKKDAKVIDELVFDVNTSYFEYEGGYEYAVKFYEEAYKYAVKKVGGEQYILSAVMHADERNRSLSDDWEFDVYHYHLHVVYVPVVQKEKRYSKDHKNAELRGKLKEVIMQISHSKKWESSKALDENGKERRLENGKVMLVPSYSILQDELYNHMIEHGFDGFERGVKGSTAEHLEVTDFKVAKNREKIKELETQIRSQSKALSQIEAKVDDAKTLDSQINVVDNLGKKKLFSDKVELSTDDYKKLVSVAKNGIALQKDVKALKQEVASLEKDISWFKNQYSAIKQKYEDLLEYTKDFRDALKHAPQKITEFIGNLLAPIRRKEQEELENSNPSSIRERLSNLRQKRENYGEPHEPKEKESRDFEMTM
jgi:hypothetical protein